MKKLDHLEHLSRDKKKKKTVPQRPKGGVGLVQRQGHWKINVNKIKKGRKNLMYGPNNV